MLSKRILATALLSCLSAVIVASCSSASGRGTEVTRFHLKETIPPQPVVIKPGEDMDTESIEYNNYVQIVSDSLTGLGFTVVDADDTKLAAIVDVTRGMQQRAPKSSGLRIGLGMGSFGSSGGVGVGGSAPVGGSSGGEVYVTSLNVALRDTQKNANLWEGTAVQAAEDVPASPVSTVRFLSQALFSDFPGESGKTVTVKEPTSK